MKKTEFALINDIKNIIDRKYSILYPLENGIGDDCAFISNIKTDENIVVSIDALVENVHFDLSYYKMYDVGYKSAIVNISDIIAKGANPISMFISLAIPKKITDNDILEWYDGFTDACLPFNAIISGGDTTSSKSDFFISVTAMGKLNSNIKILRSTAKHGDNIYVLGRLGESAIGLDILQNKSKIKNQKCVHAHLRPKLFYLEFQKILSKYKVNASLDISDGLLQDISHIARASNVICEINDYANFSYVNDVYKNIEPSQRKNIIEYILNGGEDYAIAFTSADNISEAENIIHIGTVRKVEKDEEPKVTLYDKNKNPYEINRMGYTHF